MSNAEPRRELRKRFLQAIYDLAAGDPNQFVYWPNVALRLGWNAENREHLEEALGCADYLAGLGLIAIEDKKTCHHNATELVLPCQREVQLATLRALRGAAS